MLPPRVMLRVHVAGDATARVMPLLDSAERVLWAGQGAPAGATPVRVRALRDWLGQTVDALVLDLRGEALDLELIAVGAGLVRAGGRVVLVLDVEGRLAGRPPSLAVAPFAPSDVGRRSYDRLITLVPEAPASLPPVPPRTPMVGNAQTEELAARLAASWSSPTPQRHVLLADRGRGKSSTVGQAVARSEREVVVSAAHEEALVELRRFAGRPLRFVPPAALALREVDADVVVIDEAAQLPIALSRQIAERQARAHSVWISTTGGYEGTGRGLLLRWLAWARAQGPLVEHTLAAPIRWGEGDPVEATVRELFPLDAMPEPPGTGPLIVRGGSLDELAGDPRMLRQVIAILGWAHYRTTPGDVARLLDAPNLALHLASMGGVVVGVNLIAKEGGLSLEAAAAASRQRLRGHALADTLASHSARPDAAVISMRRSVRIAVHPEVRRAGVARALVEHVHRTEDGELFGTLFGATAELIRFRRALGYEVVRLGSSRGERSGEPSVVMLRAASPRAAALVAALRGELAVDLPHQLTLLGAEAPVAAELEEALRHGLPDVPPSGAHVERARRYLSSAQPIEACIGAVRALALAHGELLAALPGEAHALIEARVVRLTSWAEAAEAAGVTLPEAQRKMRGAVASLLAAVDRSAGSSVSGGS